MGRKRRRIDFYRPNTKHRTYCCVPLYLVVGGIVCIIFGSILIIIRFGIVGHFTNESQVGYARRSDHDSEDEEIDKHSLTTDAQVVAG